MKGAANVKAQLLYDSGAMLGEGPVWDHKRQVLYWVDIEKGCLHRHEPLSGANKKWVFPETLGAVVPTDQGNLLLALESGLASYSLEKKALVYLNVLQNSDPKIRFNDGKCDPLGNFWIGTMHKEFIPASGNLYKVNGRLNSSRYIKGTTISNGMAWSLDHTTFYYIDTPTHKIQAYDYDPSSGKLANKRVLFGIPEVLGAPDGMTIDTEGMLWIAHWGGGCVRRWDPNTGKVLQEVSVGVPHVTSCCFGGENLNKLYITTARSGLRAKELETFPLSGGLFYIETKVKGLPSSFFKGKV